MTIIELPQGYYRDLSGTSKTDALAAFAKFEADYAAKHPNATPWQWWSELDVTDTATARFGYEWYRVDGAGVLRRHSARVDSSD